MSTEENIRFLVDRATQGDWWIDSHGHHVINMETLKTIFKTDIDSMVPATRHPETGNLSHWPNDWDAPYIVAVQPKNVKALLDEIDELRKKASLYDHLCAMIEQQVEEDSPQTVFCV